MPLARPAVEIIAHRGASFDAPENTLAALRLAFDQGADAVECDVRRSADGHLVVIHDADTARVSGHPGSVADMTLADLKALDVGHWKGERFAGERIPTLAEWLEAVPAGKRAYVEVKGPATDVAELARVWEAVGRPLMTIISFATDVIAAAKTALAQIPAYWIVDLPNRAAARDINSQARASGADGLDFAAHREIAPVYIASAVATGLPAVVWTVDEADTAWTMFAAGARGITTNRPAALRAAIQIGSRPSALDRSPSLDNM